MASKVILSDYSTKHTSRLIKSFKAIDNLEDFSKKPEGVWGSISTIKCNDVTIKSSELDFEFNVPFDDNLESDEGEVIVYNLSDNTIKQLGKSAEKKGNKISIEAGYEGDSGVIFDGYVTTIVTRREGADKVTRIRIIDGFTTSTDELIESGKLEESYDGERAQDVLRAMVEAEGSPIAKFKVSSDYEYENSVSISGDLESEIKRQSEICGVSTFKSKGKIYCCKLSDVSSDITFNVSEDTGMIGSPSPFEETVTVGDKKETIKGFEIEMLLQHRAAVGAIVNLTSEQYKGKYYIKSGTHRFNSLECTTKIKVVEK